MVVTLPKAGIEYNIQQNSSKDSTMIIKKLRLQRGWSQEHLSQFSGLSVRTIQRIENGQKAGLESLKSLAAVFDMQVTELQKEEEMTEQAKEPSEQRIALQEVREIKHFYSRLSTYLVVISLLLIINFMTNPSYIWAWWPALGWGIGIILHGLKTFKIINFWDAGWEKKQVEKRLGKKS